MAAGLTIRVSADIKRVTRGLDAAARKQIPFATARAVNDVAFDVMRAERANLVKVLAHPRPFTQRSVGVPSKAAKGKPTATVAVRPEVARYLAPYETGGQHHMPGRGIALVVPKAVRLDQYGQLRGRPSTLGNRRNVFVGTVQTKDGSVNGFWQRVGGKQGGRLKLLARFEDALPVKKRLGFQAVALREVKAKLPTALRTQLAKALATARP